MSPAAASVSMSFSTAAASVSVSMCRRGPHAPLQRLQVATVPRGGADGTFLLRLVYFGSAVLVAPSSAPSTASLVAPCQIAAPAARLPCFLTLCLCLPQAGWVVPLSTDHTLDHVMASCVRLLAHAVGPGALACSGLLQCHIHFSTLRIFCHLHP